MRSCGSLGWTVGAWEEHQPGSGSQTLNEVRRKSMWRQQGEEESVHRACLLYTSDAADECVNV